MATYLFENVIVEPRLSIDDFGADKIGKEEKKEINGKKYVAKFNGLLTALKAIDSSYIDGAENISLEKLSKILFEKVVVKPEKLTADDFESMKEFSEVVSFAREVMQGGDIWEEFNEIVAFARGVMQGDFREEKDTLSTSGASKK